MKKFLLVTTSILLLAAACNKQQAQVQSGQNQNKPTFQQATSTDELTNWKINSENAVSVFIKDVNTSGYGSNIIDAFGLLSSRAQEKVITHSKNNTPKEIAS